jgi:predicted PurR-regulated permease PerM
LSEETRSRTQAVAVGGVVVILAFFAIQLMITLRVELAVLFLGFVLGISLAPVAEYGERFRVPRIASVLLVYAMLAGGLGLLTWWAVPVIADEVTAAGEAIDDLEVWYEDFSEGTSLPAMEDLVAWGESALAGRLSASLEQAFVVFEVLLYLFMVLLIALFVTITKDRMYQLTLSLLPARRRPATAAFLCRVAARLRRYVMATVATQFAVGIATYIGLVILGVPLAPLLAVLAFVFEVVPLLGPWLAFFPAFIVALSEGLPQAIAVCVLYLVVQQLEAHVLVPIFQSRGVNLPGLLIVTAVLVGYPLLGILGALVAIPVAVILYSVVHDVLVPWRQGQVEAPLTSNGVFQTYDPNPMRPPPATEPEA